jgi:hypothetical protein
MPQEEGATASSLQTSRKRAMRVKTRVNALVCASKTRVIGLMQVV